MKKEKIKFILLALLAFLLIIKISSAAQLMPCEKAENKDKFIEAKNRILRNFPESTLHKSCYCKESSPERKCLLGIISIEGSLKTSNETNSSYKLDFEVGEFGAVAPNSFNNIEELKKSLNEFEAFLINKNISINSNLLYRITNEEFSIIGKDYEKNRILIRFKYENKTISEEPYPIGCGEREMIKTLYANEPEIRFIFSNEKTMKEVEDYNLKHSCFISGKKIETEPHLKNKSWILFYDEKIYKSLVIELNTTDESEIHILEIKEKNPCADMKLPISKVCPKKFLGKTGFNKIDLNKMIIIVLALLIITILILTSIIISLKYLKKEKKQENTLQTDKNL